MGNNVQIATISISIFDIHGKMVLSNYFQNNALKEEFLINHLQNGVYTVQIKSPNLEVVTKKFIKI
jgi:hypothetical protein